jgi:hypothetical protein
MEVDTTAVVITAPAITGTQGAIMDPGTMGVVIMAPAITDTATGAVGPQRIGGGGPDFRLDWLTPPMGIHTTRLPSLQRSNPPRLRQSSRNRCLRRPDQLLSLGWTATKIPLALCLCGRTRSRAIELSPGREYGLAVTE